MVTLHAHENVVGPSCARPRVFPRPRARAPHSLHLHAMSLDPYGASAQRSLTQTTQAKRTWGASRARRGHSVLPKRAMALPNSWTMISTRYGSTSRNSPAGAKAASRTPSRSTFQNAPKSRYEWRTHTARLCLPRLPPRRLIYPHQNPCQGRHPPLRPRRGPLPVRAAC